MLVMMTMMMVVLVVVVTMMAMMTMTIKRKHNLTRTDDECPAAEARVIHQPRGDEGCRDLRRRAQAKVEVAVIGHQS